MKKQSQKAKKPIATKLQLAIQKDFERLLKADTKKQTKLVTQLQKDFQVQFDFEKRYALRIAKKKRLESKTIIPTTKRKLKVSNKKVTYENIAGMGLQAISKKDFYFLKPLLMNENLVENNFIDIMKANFLDSMHVFLKNFNPKHDYSFTVGYHFFFEGLKGQNNSHQTGYRAKIQLQNSRPEIIKIFNNIFKSMIDRFKLYYQRANNNVLKFEGITLEVTKNNPYFSSEFYRAKREEKINIRSK